MHYDIENETLFGIQMAAPSGLPGPITLISTKDSLVKVAFPGDSKPLYRGHEPPFLAQAVSELTEYLHGKRTTFDLSLLLQGTPFQILVWEALCEIPYGETRTYGDIARSIGHPKAFQAVGSAVGANPLAILIPCHRVLPASGQLGGFRAGPEWKQFLLNLERTEKRHG